MKSLIVLLVLQIFIGHAISDVIDDNRESAMNAIKECIDESKVNLEDLESAVKKNDYDLDQNEVETFAICYEDRMGGINALTDHCEEKEGNAKLYDLIKCYQGILFDYLKDYFK